MVFAVIGIRSRSDILFVEWSIDADKYLENFTQLGFVEEPDRRHGALEWIFQQDGHATNHKRQLIGLRRIVISSPTGSKFARPQFELKPVIEQAWRTISQKTIDDLCAGFARRLQICLDGEGHSIAKLLGPCREIQAFTRWRSMNQNHEPWTPVEDLQLYKTIHELGT
jgi:hypothetical protein